jgi:RNA polymerase sigma factor (sigma-70 family)
MKSKEDFVKIVLSNEGLIHKVAKLYTNNYSDEEDLFQEIVYQLWKSFGSFREESKITTWMYRIALNTAISQLNKHKRGLQLIPINDDLLNYADVSDNLKEEQIAHLYKEIKALNPVEKGIILLYLEGKKYEEIAIITGFNASNIGTRLNRIKQKIKAQIK